MLDTVHRLAPAIPEQLDAAAPCLLPSLTPGIRVLLLSRSTSVVDVLCGQSMALGVKEVFLICGSIRCTKNPGHIVLLISCVRTPHPAMPIVVPSSTCLLHTLPTWLGRCGRRKRRGIAWPVVRRCLCRTFDDRNARGCGFVVDLRCVLACACGIARFLCVFQAPFRAWI